MHVYSICLSCIARPLLAQGVIAATVLTPCTKKWSGYVSGWSCSQSHHFGWWHWILWFLLLYCCCAYLQKDSRIFVYRFRKIRHVDVLQQMEKLSTWGARENKTVNPRKFYTIIGHSGYVIVSYFKEWILLYWDWIRSSGNSMIIIN